MNFSYFTSFFEIFAGLTFGYAAFKYFRTEIANSVFKINSSSKKLEDLKSRVVLQESEPENQKEALLKVLKKYKIKQIALNQDDLKHQYFYEVLKPISFMLFLLCITYLVVAGFQQEAKEVNKILFNEFYFSLNCFTAAFTFIIFYSTFSNRVLNHKIKIDLTDIFISFFIFSTFSCTFIKKLFIINDIIQLTFFLVLPILVYWLFIYLKVKKIEKYKTRKFAENFTCFTNLCSENFWHIVIFLLIVTLAFTPVVLHFYCKEYVFIEYLIILITPLFLFIFMTIRVIYHYKIFSQKYKKLSDEETVVLDSLLN